MIVKATKGKSVSVKKILETGINFEHRFIKDYDELKNVIESLKNLGYKISMTQGVWDMLHIGHLRYLNEAKSKGDILVVEVDTDENTRKRKGPTRPVVPERERLEMLAGLRCIDILMLRRSNNDPNLGLKVVRPDVLIVSSSTEDVGDKKRKEMAKYCGKIIVLEPQATISTTSRIRKLLIDGANKLAKEIQNTVEKYLKT